MKLVTGITLGLGLLLATGCATSRSDLFKGEDNQTGSNQTRMVKSGAGSSSISAVYSSNNCSAITRGGFIWLTDQVVLADLLAPIGVANADLVLNQVNFATQGALMVDFGVMPTPDYRVKLFSERLQLDGPKAIVQLDLVKPAATAQKRQPQVVTHPCAIYVMPRVGFSTLEIQSELGDVFTSFSN